MKKITQKLFFLMLTVLSISAFAQTTTYYEDFRYDTGNNGFTVQKVALGGQAAGDVGKRVGDIVDAADSSPVFDESSRPTTRIPQGGSREQRTISFKNGSGDPVDTNHEIEAWALMTNQDLSAANLPKVSFWTQQRSVVGGGATLTVWVSENYTHGMLPSTATWTDETANITGAIATSDVSNNTFVNGELDLSAYSGASVTVAFKVVTDNTAFDDGVNQHGIFYISDVKFTTTPQDVANGAFSAANTSSSGQPNIFNVPSASIDNANFTNNGNAWGNILVSPPSNAPRLFWASGNEQEAPINEGYKFEVAAGYNPFAASEVRYILQNAASNKGSTGGVATGSIWKVQASNDDSTWDDVSAPVEMFGTNTGNSFFPITLTGTKAYRYYRFVLATEWTPNSKFTQLLALEFTADSSVILSNKDNVLNNAFSVYPNPTNSAINISKSNTSVNIKNVKLFDVTGKVIYNNPSAQPINVRNYSKGLYILRIESQEGGVASRKVIVN